MRSSASKSSVVWGISSRWLTVGESDSGLGALGAWRAWFYPRTGALGRQRGRQGAVLRCAVPAAEMSTARLPAHHRQVAHPAARRGARGAADPARGAADLAVHSGMARDAQRHVVERRDAEPQAHSRIEASAVPRRARIQRHLQTRCRAASFACLGPQLASCAMHRGVPREHTSQCCTPMVRNANTFRSPDLASEHAVEVHGVAAIAPRPTGGMWPEAAVDANTAPVARVLCLGTGFHHRHRPTVFTEHSSPCPCVSMW
jgi:hypothetical protein